jgi:hypothetical protein
MASSAAIGTGSMFALCVVGALGVSAYPDRAASANCLERNNVRVSVEHKEVYQNGKLKFRLDAWLNDGRAGGYVNVKSNAPGFHGRSDLYYGKVVMTDTDLCPGVELSATCVHDEGRYYSCLFSEW